jgi:hypothetical protein
MAQLTEFERRDVEEAVRRDLPGWKLSNARPTHKRPATGVADGLSVKRVGDFEQLKKKFLGRRAASGDGADRTASARPQPSAPQSNVRTVLVEPVNGGAPKIADVVNGHVTIVQG